ncbi:1-deoxy-D-xylulose-5-phosphate synthase [Croceivirga radicis]|uniref:1-deoxy-D-xylulose-5-phosphate synthase n=1 Tax=Croceivirga radicis TaxID=1929488 RepID=UPI000255B52C|nr:1-deoxy-D-xylulose-5-phosphate synthase [Croceivirga radicis]
MKKVLDKINAPADLKVLQLEELVLLAKELRAFIIDVVATKEGHLGASLGVVELTIAIHYVFNTPTDKLIWDVGHQAYGHKILTGRRSRFHTNRQLNGISGFPKMDESKYDAFGTGHSSTSISAILGMALASQLNKSDNAQHVAVIGDASIASGMAFEALNHLGETNTNVLVILNDNTIGIDPSVGALKKYLTNVKKGTAKEENIFECLNLTYSGPVDGHNLPLLITELERLKTVDGPKLLHVITTKGKGLKQAEKDQVTYHAPGKFNAKTGEREHKPLAPEPPKFQDVFGKTIIELAEKNEQIVGITPAMPTGSSLKYMMEKMPDRAFDVGIAEQHAVTLAAGMASNGLIPFCNIYSTFVQRGYDQIIHDVAIQNIPVVFCLDRAGLVGEDGTTHHGIYDIAFLRCIPNMIVFSPLDEVELRNIMYTAQKGLKQPIAIRYPRGRGYKIDWQQPMEPITIGSSVCLKQGSKTAVLSFGPIGNTVKQAIAEANNPAKIGHFNMRFAKPLDTQALDAIFKNYEQVVTVEDGCIIGGFGSAVLEYANSKGFKTKIKQFGVPDNTIGHGTIKELHDICGISWEQIKNYLDQTN